MRRSTRKWSRLEWQPRLTQTHLRLLALSWIASGTSLFFPRIARMTIIFGQHFQVIRLLQNFWFGNAVEELPHPRVSAGLHLLLRTDGYNIPFVDEHHAVGDQERTGQFVGHDYDRHVEGFLQLENQFINAGGNDGVESR